MDDTISVHAAKTHLSQLLARVREVVDDVRAHSTFRSQTDSARVQVHEHAGVARFADPHAAADDKIGGVFRRSPGNLETIVVTGGHAAPGPFDSPSQSPIVLVRDVFKVDRDL